MDKSCENCGVALNSRDYRINGNGDCYACSYSDKFPKWQPKPEKPCEIIRNCSNCNKGMCEDTPYGGKFPTDCKNWERKITLEEKIRNATIDEMVVTICNTDYFGSTDINFIRQIASELKATKSK